MTEISGEILRNFPDTSGVARVSKGAAAHPTTIRFPFFVGEGGVLKILLLVVERGNNYGSAPGGESSSYASAGQKMMMIIKQTFTRQKSRRQGIGSKACQQLKRYIYVRLTLHFFFFFTSTVWLLSCSCMTLSQYRSEVCGCMGSLFYGCLTPAQI